jgi:hypothetical protein
MPQTYLLVYRQPYRTNDGRVRFREEREIVSVGSTENPAEVKKRHLAKNAVKDGDKVHPREFVAWGPQPHSMHSPHDRAAYI